MSSMSRLIILLIIIFPFIVQGQSKSDTIKTEQEKIETEIQKHGQVTIIDTSLKVPEKRLIMKGKMEKERIMVRVEEDYIHPADARVYKPKAQKWTLGMVLVDSEEGLLIEEVKDGTAASKAGLKAGDIIRWMEGEKIDTKLEFIQIWREFEEGDMMLLRIKQGLFGKKVWLTFE